jgi:hypothetical protein
MVMIAARTAKPLDLLEQGAAGGGWDGLDALFLPQEMKAAFQPKDTVAKYLFGLSHTAQGREIIEWLMDITVRQPVRITGSTIEETALRAATLQGIHGVGESILKAIAAGEKLVHPNGAGS